MHIVFPRTNKKLLKSKEFEDNHVEFYPAKPLEPGTDELDFNTQHFRVACVGGIIMINGGMHYSGNKIKDKKETQLLNKELKEFTDEFGKYMEFQIYNPF